jgi:hypothetical protein
MNSVLYLTPRELADRWKGRVKLSTLRNWRYHGRGPTFIKFGWAVAYCVADVVAFEKSRPDLFSSKPVRPRGP